jgi:hypothetical protein
LEDLNSGWGIVWTKISGFWERGTGRMALNREEWRKLLKKVKGPHRAVESVMMTIR